MPQPPDSAQAGTRRVALLTGAARRIGAAIARALHASGYDLCLHYRASAREAAALIGELCDLRPHSAHALSAELSDDGAPRQLVEAAIGRFGRLDALVNNAAVFRPTPFGTVQARDWFELMAVNLRAPFLLAQAAAPQLAANQGAIVNVADVYGERPLRGHSVYSISKAGLIMLTRSLALELAPQVRVNAVAPGAILWPEDGDAAHAAAILARTALHRSGEPQDIAQAVCFLLQARYVTGQVLAVDGGRLLHI